LDYLSRLVSRIFQSHRLLFFPGRCTKDERLVEFSNAVTNSGVGLIGGSCTGGVVALVVVIYLLYRLFYVKNDDTVRHLCRNVPSCPHCRNVPSCPHCRNVPSCPHCRNVPSCPHCRNVPDSPHCCNVPRSPHCRNVPSSPPPAYEEVSVMGDLEWSDLPGALMSAPPANSKQPAI